MLACTQHRWHQHEVEIVDPHPGVVCDPGQNRFGEILTTRNLELSMLAAVKSNGQQTMLQKNDINLSSIAVASKKGDQLAQDALREFGQILGVLTISVINLFNPELIIMGGPVIDKCPFVLDEAIMKAKEDVLVVPAEFVKIRPGALKNRAGTLGAVGMVLQDLFKPPIVNLATYRSLILPE